MLCIQSIHTSQRVIQHLLTHYAYRAEKNYEKMAWARANACSVVCAFEFSTRNQPSKRGYIACQNLTQKRRSSREYRFSLPNLPSFIFTKRLKFSEKWWSLINDMQSNALGRNDTGFRWCVCMCEHNACVYVLFSVSSPYIHIHILPGLKNYLFIQFRVLSSNMLFNAFPIQIQ